MLSITATITIADHEIDMFAIRAQGSGGQNVNKVSSAIHLRFEIRQSSLPEEVKERLLKINDKRINSDGIIVIKAQQYRSQEQNKVDALSRLQMLVKRAVIMPKKRKPSRRSLGSIKRRLESKNKRSKLKSLRKNTLE